MDINVVTNEKDMEEDILNIQRKAVNIVLPKEDIQLLNQKRDLDIFFFFLDVQIRSAKVLRRDKKVTFVLWMYKRKIHLERTNKNDKKSSYGTLSERVKIKTDKNNGKEYSAGLLGQN